MRKEWFNLIIFGLGFVIISAIFGYAIYNNISSAETSAKAKVPASTKIDKSLGWDKLVIGLKGLSKYSNSTDSGKIKNLDSILLSYIEIALGFVIFIAVGSIVFSGYLYMSASGDEARLEKAKKSLIFSITGLILSLLIYAIPVFVNSVLKL